MFGWFIWIFIFLILLGNERTGIADSWSWRNNYYSGIFTGRAQKNKTDFEIRTNYRMNSLQRVPEIVVVKPGDHIGQPDHHIEKLIRDGKLDEAREYRIEMEKIAEEMENDESLRKYAIYGARIAKRHKELQRMDTRKKYRAFADPPWAAGARSSTDAGDKTIKAAGVISTVSASADGKNVKPPLWGAKSKPVSSGSKPSSDSPITIPRLKKPLKQPIPKDTDQLTPIGRPVPRYTKDDEVEKTVAEPVRHIKPTTRPEPPEPPKPIETPPIPDIPDDFTPPPAGPVQLGGPDGYKSGPVKSSKGTIKDPESKDKTPPEDDKLDPDDFNELISF